MKILSSNDNKKHELNNKTVTIYNCGPTVYNHVHIGNVRPLITFDVLYRYLEKTGKKVKYIHNITDVDDKIINAAIQSGVSEKTLANKYLSAYKNLFNVLNIKKVNMPKVSEHIDDIIKYIQKQIKNGSAYVSDGDVYFNIQKLNNYGHISHKNIDELLDGTRKTNKGNKRFPLDFALWKKTDVGIKWKSPWSQGRPGWHTECCVLINLLVGDHVTIHGGGVDLKFPHHENENAQNYALFKRDIADVWMHVGHVNVNGVKMAKSLGNYIFVKDIVTKDNANGLRWFFYKTRYQHPINFSKQLLEEANNEINRIVSSLAVAKTYLLVNKKFKLIKKASLNKDFSQALNDDLNLPNAITCVLSEVKELNLTIRTKDWNKANGVYNTITQELDILGIVWNKYKHKSNLKLISKWAKAVKEKKYDVADVTRKQLQARGLL